MIIILDQFEEYLRYHPLEDDFEEEFSQAVMQRDLPVHFLISIREDSLGRLDRFERRIPGLLGNTFRFEHLDLEAARTAILGPIEQHNRLHVTDGQPISIEPALVEYLLQQLRHDLSIRPANGRAMVRSESNLTSLDTQIETPHLQLVMTRLWDEEMQSGSHILRLETLNRLGGPERIVRSHLDIVMSALPTEQQEVVARVFRYLVTPSGEKIAHTVSDLATYAGLPQETVTLVLLKLSDVRIVRVIVQTSDQSAEPRYEIYHDVLARAILDWVGRYAQTQERVEAEKRMAIEAAAREEERTRELELEHAQAFAAEQGKASLRLRRLAVALAIMVVVAIAVASIAFTQWTKAERAGARALQTEQKLAQQRIEAAESQKRLADALAQQATHEKLLAVAERARAEKLRESAVVAQRELGRNTALRLALLARDRLGLNRELGLLLARQAVLATYLVDKTVVPEAIEALDLALQQFRVGKTILPGQGLIYSGVFNPDGKSLATARQEEAVDVWGVAPWTQLTGLSTRAGPAEAVAFSPDGRVIAIGNRDSTVKLSDLSFTKESTILIVHQGRVYSVTFSPDGKSLATGGEDTTVKLWDVASGKELRTLSGHRNVVYAVTFSPDGKSLATASNDRTTRLWDTTTGTESLKFSGYDAGVIAVKFISDRSLMTVARNWVVQIHALAIDDLLALASKHATRAFTGEECQQYFIGGNQCEAALATRGRH